jgi:hypothetical protein
MDSKLVLSKICVSKNLFVFLQKLACSKLVTQRDPYGIRAESAR